VVGSRGEATINPRELMARRANGCARELVSWPASRRFVWSIAMNGSALMPTSFLTARLGARVAHHVSKRRLELCFASYLIIVGGQFGLSLI
jgi:uncharacterized membrane protein YfcA